MERWVKVSSCSIRTRDLNGRDKNGPAIVYSTVGSEAQYKLTLLNQSIEVKKLV